MLNWKYTNEIANLLEKIESHKQEEKRLLDTIEEYKAEIDQLNNNLNSYQSLSDNLVKVQQEFIAFNKKCSKESSSKVNTNITVNNPILSTNNPNYNNYNGIKKNLALQLKKSLFILFIA